LKFEPTEFLKGLQNLKELFSNLDVPFTDFMQIINDTSHDFEKFFDNHKVTGVLELLG